MQAVNQTLEEDHTHSKPQINPQSLNPRRRNPVYGHRSPQPNSLQSSEAEGQELEDLGSEALEVIPRQLLEAKVAFRGLGPRV